MSSNNINYNLSSSIAYAVFNKKPLIIVEGEDDMPFYKKVISNGNFRVICSELMDKEEDKKYTPGCEGVIDIVEDVQELIDKNSKVSKYFIGIIDRDCRRYIKDQDIELPCLFKLHYYSYESHFVTESSLRQLIESTTGILAESITQDIIDILREEVEKSISDLYYVSLDVLKGRIDSEYTSCGTFEAKPENLYQYNTTIGSTLIDRVLTKKDILDAFAYDTGIERENPKNIIKGKWYLYAYVKNIYEKIKNVRSTCNSAEIDQCDFCQKEEYDKCIWKVKLQLNRGEYIYHMVNINIEREPEIQYIRNKLLSLG